MNTMTKVVLAVLVLVNVLAFATYLLRTVPTRKRDVIERHWDFGKFRNFTGMLRRQFTIKNDSDEAWILTKRRSSCSCTVADVDFKRLAPGESGSVALAMKVNPGDTRAGANVTVFLEGVESRKQTIHRFNIEARIERPYVVTVEPEAFCLSAIGEVTGPITRKVIVREFFATDADLSGRPVVETTRPGEVSAVVRDVMEGGVDSVGRNIRTSVIDLRFTGELSGVFRDVADLRFHDSKDPTYSTERRITWYGEILAGPQ